MREIESFIGRTLGSDGRFTIETFVGEGAYGYVFRGSDSESQAKVAIKLLKNSKIASADSAVRFVREGSHQELVHPNLCRVLCSGVEFGRPYIISEYVHGGSVGDIIDSGSLITAIDTIALIVQAACGIAYLHNADMVHRDIKPANLLLDNNKTGLKVSDYGLLRHVITEAEITLPGYVVGTPLFMAPEVTANGEISLSMDIFALGVTAYNMLTGTYPFEGRDAKQLQQSMDKNRYISLTARLTNADQSVLALDELIKLMVCSKAARRPPCDQVLVSLRKLAE